jgi:hypothetical protein
VEATDSSCPSVYGIDSRPVLAQAPNNAITNIREMDRRITASVSGYLLEIDRSKILRCFPGST